MKQVGKMGKKITILNFKMRFVILWAQSDKNSCRKNFIIYMPEDGIAIANSQLQMIAIGLFFLIFSPQFVFTVT